jgi:hypothetical protein
MALPLLLPMKLVIIYIEASYLVGIYGLEEKCGELYGGLPCIYMTMILWAHQHHSSLRGPGS